MLLNFDRLSPLEGCKDGFEAFLKENSHIQKDRLLFIPKYGMRRRLRIQPVALRLVRRLVLFEFVFDLTRHHRKTGILHSI